MRSVDAAGVAIENRHTSRISTIDELDVAIWQAAYRGGAKYRIEGFVVQNCMPPQPSAPPPSWPSPSPSPPRSPPLTPPWPTQPPSPIPPSPPKCGLSSPLVGKYLARYCGVFEATLEAALEAALTRESCNGVTLEQSNPPRYTGRAGVTPFRSLSGEISWLLLRDGCLEPPGLGDGIPDAKEGTTDTDSDGIPDDLNPDSDADGPLSPPPPPSPAAPVSDVCYFKAGDGIGGTAIMVDSARSAQACAKTVARLQPSANGATYSASGDGLCYAEFGATGANGNTNWQTCIFDSSPLLPPPSQPPAAAVLSSPSAAPTPSSDSRLADPQPACDLFITGSFAGKKTVRHGCSSVVLRKGEVCSDFAMRYLKCGDSECASPE